MELFNPGLFVISAPSGTGKTSIIKAAQQILPNLKLSVSYTTRSPRPGEVNGVDYHFVTHEEFQARIQEGDFLEWAEVYGNFYGTSRQQIQESRAAGNIVLLDIDVQGAMSLQKDKSLGAKYIFIKPPSLEELKRRLIGRGTETEESLAKRLGNAEHELSFQNRYSFHIVNDRLEWAVERLVTYTLEKSIHYKGTLAQEQLESVKERVKSPEAGAECHPLVLRILQHLSTAT